jgi:hypothetical protein
MRLWTVQPVAVWELLQAEGRVFVDPAWMNPEGWIHPQYSWLAWQLRSRLAGSRGCLPWWAYCKRPDLRWVRHLRPQGAREVLIDFEAPAGAFVDFPCWAWQTVFLGEYLARYAAEYRDWAARLRREGIAPDSAELPEAFQAELEASWRRLFHPDLPCRSWRRGGDDSREAVVEVLELGWVRRVREFMGTHPRLAQLAGPGN